MPKVLLADDEEAIRSVLGKLLEKAGFAVVTAASAAAATALLGEAPVDIVVTDLRMESPLAGFEVVKAAAKMMPRPVIVVLTAFPVPRSTWKDTGADALLIKGENPAGIPRQLKALLNERASS